MTTMNAESYRAQLRRSIEELYTNGNAAQRTSFHANALYQADALADEVERLRAIIDRIDRTAPRADATCNRPGITLSEAARRTLRDEGHPLFQR